MTPPTSAPITPWLHLLSQLMPPTGVLLVGASAGTGPWVQLLQSLAVPSATLVEADDTQFEHLQRSVPQRAGWRLRKQVVGPHTETVTYYRASNAVESGLLEPESLRSLWPNLKTTHQQTRQAITLAELQQEAETPANWLLVDCLPALPIIQGGAEQLAAFDVIALRVLLDNSVDELEITLQTLGFRCLAIETSRHPALGHALFVRDTAAQAKAASNQFAAERLKLNAQLQQLKETAEKAKAAAAEATTAANAAAAAATKQAEERAAQVQQLTQAKAAADKLATERQQQIYHLQAQHDQFSQENAKLTADNTELTKTADQSSAQKNAEIKARAEAIAQRDAEVKAKTEAIAQRDQLAKDKAALAADRDEQAKLAAERQTALTALQTQQKDSTTKLQRLQQLEADNQEYAARQQMLQEELIKAEAQIDLIKDLLLREPGL